MFNGFKKRLRDHLILEQSKSLTKENAIDQFIKRTDELNVYVNTANVKLPDESDDEREADSPLVVRNRAKSFASNGREKPKLTEDQLAKLEMERE